MEDACAIASNMRGLVCVWQRYLPSIFGFRPVSMKSYFSTYIFYIKYYSSSDSKVEIPIVVRNPCFIRKSGLRGLKRSRRRRRKFGVQETRAYNTIIFGTTLGTHEIMYPGYSIHTSIYKLAWPRIVFFLASICHAITDPPVTKIRLWASFGV
jgi:hypothetical protein